MTRSSNRGMLEKGLSLLVALGSHPDGVGPSELARELKMSVSTVQRLLASMVPLGFVRFDTRQRRYLLGFKIFELSNKVVSARGLSEVARPVMKSVAEATGETVLMTVLDGDEMLFVERVEGRHRLQIRNAIGRRGPLYCTSLGKVLLAFLPEEEREEIIDRLELDPIAPKAITDKDALRRNLELTRERGYAVADEERDAEVRAVGAPVLNAEGWPVAAISVAAPLFRLSWEKIEEVGPLIIDAANEISVQLPPDAVLSGGGLR